MRPDLHWRVRLIVRIRVAALRCPGKHVFDAWNSVGRKACGERFFAAAPRPDLNERGHAMMRPRDLELARTAE
jgi:hypothetical protein